MKKYYLGTTKNGNKVYTCDETREHLLAHPDVDEDAITKAIPLMEIKTNFAITPVDLTGIRCGYDFCIPCEDGNPNKFMKKRNGRAIETPCTDKGNPIKTSILNVGICLDDDGLLTVFNAFWGKSAPKEPNDPRLKPEEKAESVEFWSHHAIRVGW